MVNHSLWTLVVLFATSSVRNMGSQCRAQHMNEVVGTDGRRCLTKPAASRGIGRRGDLAFLSELCLISELSRAPQ